MSFLYDPSLTASASPSFNHCSSFFGILCQLPIVPTALLRSPVAVARILQMFAVVLLFLALVPLIIHSFVEPFLVFLLLFILGVDPSFIYSYRHSFPYHTLYIPIQCYGIMYPGYHPSTIVVSWIHPSITPKVVGALNYCNSPPVKPLSIPPSPSYQVFVAWAIGFDYYLFVCHPVYQCRRMYFPSPGSFMPA
jgi:hypothetical protein